MSNYSTPDEQMKESTESWAPVDRMKESTESWEVLSVPSASGIDTPEETFITVSQLLPPRKTKKEIRLEQLLSDAQRESLQNSARHSLRQSKQGSPTFPESPAESGDYYISYEEFNRQMLSPSNADGSTDWFWDWTYNENGAKVYHRRRIPRQPSIGKRRFFGLLLLTNFIALLLGAGLGYYLGKKILAGEELADINEWELLPSVEGSVFKFN
ncbi:hypothetical protein BV898_12611 [Hypsibius exemplaris]|uniref:BCL2/adenovirus E1B 19 kDa protein-interacting protein 3 n=1 Tax=Hypsibius exemplaris TaxID=2072580 RepID=A0A1W0WDH6_HYPEX|nr:hypothetical protein BV898_12611 [Hypsibius exemplaris]